MPPELRHLKQQTPHEMMLPQPHERNYCPGRWQTSPDGIVYCYTSFAISHPGELGTQRSTQFNPSRLPNLNPYDYSRHTNTMSMASPWAPKFGYDTDTTPLATRFPFQPYRGTSMIDRLQNYTGVVYQPAQEGAPPGFFDTNQSIVQSHTQTGPGVYENTQTNSGYFDDQPPTVYPYPENIQTHRDYDQGKYNRDNDSDSSDWDGVERCYCIANSGRYAGSHCFQDLYGLPCGTEQCTCVDKMLGGSGCPPIMLGQPCDTNITHREPYDPTDDAGRCICVDYTWKGAHCPPSKLGRQCTAGGKYQPLDPNIADMPDKSWLYKLRAV